MKNFLLILTASILISFSSLIAAGCSACVPASYVSCSSCQTSSSCYDMPRPSCQCTDPYCFDSQRVCMGMGSCCQAFGNVGTLDEDRDDSF